MDLIDLHGGDLERAGAGTLNAVVKKMNDGTYRYIFSRGGGINPPETFLVGTLDGPVLFASISTVALTKGLRINPAGLDNQHFGIELGGGATIGVHADDQHRHDVLLGTLGEWRPKLLRIEQSADVPEWFVNDAYVGRIGSLSQSFVLTPQGGGTAVTVWSGTSDPDGLQAGSAILNGRDALIEVGSLRYSGIMAYDPTRGPHALIRWYGDNTQGAMGPGTDGTDLVWTWGTNHPAGEGTYPTRSLMTSPYSTDPDFVRTHARRLRSNPMWLERMVVGCGYAAHAVREATGTPGYIQVIRLSDGVAWKVVPPPTGGFDPYEAMGLTCGEVFFEASVKPAGKYQTNIFRVRIDSLGAGDPPD